MGSIYEQDLDENVPDENILNETRYLDSLEVGDSSDSAEATSFEEFDTQVEVIPVAKGIQFPFSFYWNVLFEPKRLPRRLEKLIYWRDTTKSGMTFTSGFLILLAIDRLSIIFVVPFLLLHIMLVSVVCRMYGTVMRAADPSVKGKRPDYDWAEYEKMVVKLPREKVQFVTGLTVERLNDLIGHLKNLFLFKNPYDSMHFGFFLMSMTVLGRMINGSTMLLLLFVFVFTIPKLYEMHKPSIDAKYDSMRKNLTAMANKFRVIISNEN